jgi:hypothetical protein
VGAYLMSGAALFCSFMKKQLLSFIASNESLSK